ncbi:MAG: peptidoglycan DD-metalloendopeptidase family protein [Endomicrobia bacterium]|nr:peptidoglycan DD-metalloendopeptidase family protein [Endomicrobiia bacterium]MCL2799530.1 peptidoglycan DD-metalloendopeptidase family protein [Endomicrobiia bacterium]
MKKYTAVIICLLQFVLSFAQEPDIKSQSKQLSEVNKTIKAKQIEKDKLALQEKVFKRELKNLNDLIERNEKYLAQIANEIKTAQKNLDNASRQYNSAFSKSAEWNQSILDEFELFHKATFVISYEKEPFVYKIMEAAFRSKKENFDKEKKVADTYSFDVKKWEKAKRELLDLKGKENKFVLERKNLMLEKNELLKSTLGKKAVAEAEIKSLNESAKDLQDLIKKLSQAQKQRQQEQQQQQQMQQQQKQQKKQKETARARTPVREAKYRKALPWPVEGIVAVNFGKNKHKELDTYVISNGIKIKAKDFAQVKSVDSGVVVFTGNFRSYGKVVIIEHSDSYFSVYGQLDKILVKDEQKVSKGTVLAVLGSGDESVLYFEIRHDNVPDNPMLWLIKGN